MKFNLLKYLSNDLEIKKLNDCLVYLFPIAFIIGNFSINLIIILLSTSFIFNFFSKKMEINKFFTKFELILFSLFFITILFNSFFSENNNASTIATAKFFFAICFSAYLANYFDSKKKLITYIKFITIIILLICIDGWIQFLFGKNIFGFESFKLHGVRLTGVFKGEAVLGSFIGKFSIICFFFLYFIKNKSFLTTFIISIFIVFSTIISNERMASILVVFGFTVFFIFYTFKTSQIKKLLFLPVLFFLVIIFIKGNENLYKQLIVKTDKYIGGITKPLKIMDSPHGAHFITAYKIFKDNKFFGVGLKNYRVKCSKEKYEIKHKFNYARCSTHPHNIFFEFLSETGIVGLVLFMCFIISVLFHRLNYFINPFYFSLALSLILFLWPLGSSGSFFSTWNGGFFWLFLGLFLSIKKMIIEKKL